MGVLIGSNETDGYPEIIRCTESLYELIDWLMIREVVLEPHLVDILDDYLLFLELSFENPGFIQTEKIDHVIKTMEQLKELSSSIVEPPGFSDIPLVSDIDEEELLLQDERVEPETEDDEIEDLLDDEADLHDIFRMECEDHLIQIGQALAVLEEQVKEPSEVAGIVGESLGDMRRAIHTLKGAAAMTGFSDLSAFAHRGEDLLDQLTEDVHVVRPEDITVLADVADVLERMSFHPDQVDPEKVAETENNLALLITAKDDLEETGSGDVLDSFDDFIDTDAFDDEDGEEIVVADDDNDFDPDEDVLLEDGFSEEDDADLHDIFSVRV